MYGKCFSCGEDGVLYNSEQRCDVCCYCGVVNDGSPLADCESGQPDAAAPVSHSETKFKFGRNGTRQGISTHTAADCKSGLTKTGVLAKECLERLLTSYGVSTSTQQQAQQLFWDNLKRRYHNREAKALAGAVFMIVMRMEKRVVSFKELAEFCDTPVKIIGRLFKHVQQDLISKGHVLAHQPSKHETVQSSIEVYASKIAERPRNAFLNMTEVVKKSLNLFDWIEACTYIQAWPPHLFALSVFFLSFKTVNVAHCYHLNIKEFNVMYDILPEKVLTIPTFNKISPKALVQEIVEVISGHRVNGLDVTPENFFFLFDMVMEMRPMFENKTTFDESSTINDEAFQRFREEKAAQVSHRALSRGDTVSQKSFSSHISFPHFISDDNVFILLCLQEYRELHAQVEDDSLSTIADSEINEYILSDNEVERRQLLFVEANKKHTSESS